MIIKKQLPQRPLSLVTDEEVSAGFPGGLMVGGGGGGNSWPAWQIAHSSALALLWWHLNCCDAFVF